MIRYQSKGSYRNLMHICGYATVEDTYSILSSKVFITSLPLLFDSNRRNSQILQIWKILNTYRLSNIVSIVVIIIKSEYIHINLDYQREFLSKIKKFKKSRWSYQIFSQERRWCIFTILSVISRNILLRTEISL